MVQSFALIIPTLNAATNFERLLPKIAAQSAQPAQFIVIDSASTDRTRQMAESAGATVVSITRAEFNHGGTRAIGLRMAKDHDVVIFMTQDAILADNLAFEAILAPFDDPQVTVACGRQLARAEANPIETFARLSNYPELSHVRSASDIPRVGFKACFCSNSFAAYRPGPLLAIGGFRSDVIFGEDTIAVAELILKGAHVAYVAGAQVVHSHGYSIAEEFRRYFDIGVLHAREKDLLAKFGSVGGAGRNFVVGELRYLLARAPWLIPEALVRTLSKFVAYKIGGMEQRLPLQAKRHLSMNGRYWQTAVSTH